jgi:hypothetical protein
MIKTEYDIKVKIIEPRNVIKKEAEEIIKHKGLTV